MYGTTNVGCNVYLVAVQVLYGVLIGVGVIGMVLAMYVMRRVKMMPAGLMGPCMLVFSFATIAFSVPHVVDPVTHTIGNDPLVTVFFAIGAVATLMLDHALLYFHVIKTTRFVYQEADVNIVHIVAKLRSLVKASTVFSILPAVPILCLLTSTNARTTEILTGVYFALLLIAGLFILTILIGFVSATIRAYDAAIKFAKNSKLPNNLNLVPKMERTRGAFAFNRFLFLYGSLFFCSLCFCKQSTN